MSMPSRGCRGDLFPHTLTWLAMRPRQHIDMMQAKAHLSCLVSVVAKTRGNRDMAAILVWRVEATGVPNTARRVLPRLDCVFSPRGGVQKTLETGPVRTIRDGQQKIPSQTPKCAGEPPFPVSHRGLQGWDKTDSDTQWILQADLLRLSFIISCICA